jgi:hypothetical protein
MNMARPDTLLGRRLHFANHRSLTTKRPKVAEIDKGIAFCNGFGDRMNGEGDWKTSYLSGEELEHLLISNFR